MKPASNFRRIAIFVAVILFGVGGAFAGWYLREQRDIDACLDAGGRWGEPGGYCIGAKFGPAEY